MNKEFEAKYGMPSQWGDQDSQNEFEEMLYARHVELESLEDLTTMRGTPIPALFNQFYKFVQNPSSVSVETFKRMIDTDDTIGSGVDFLTTALAARLGRYTHPVPEIAEFVNRMLDQIEGGWTNTVKEILSATWAGFSVSEQCWANEEDGFKIKKLVTLPPTTMLFETERTGELTYDGILQYQRNYNPFLIGGGLGYFSGSFATGVGFSGGFRPDMFAKLGDLPFPLRVANSFNYLSIRIPVKKCVHYAFDAQGKFRSPYGRSLLRRIYKYYVMKDAILQMLMVAMDRKGTPLTLVYADPNSVMEDSEKVEDNSTARGRRDQGIRADVAARKAFSNVHNDSVITLPGKKGEIYEVDVISQQSNAADFIAALDFCNKSMMRGLLLPSLIFTNGDGTGSYSLGQEHAKTFDKLCDSINSGLESVLIQQAIEPVLRYNFPYDSWKKHGLGSFSKRQLTVDEIQKEIDVIEKGVNMGAIDMNDIADLNNVRDKMGLDPRNKIIEKPMPIPFGNPIDEKSNEVT